ncbi:MAG: putative DNA binding domain-containing protein [Lachnospiraceae bacterium]|nr:putative DNA binding domain-containing protein [Lachnospiraceae bacterium]
MAKIVAPKFSTIEELKEWLKNVHEKYYIEMKAASELPNAFWESYSSFCNTSGGWIILGVAEDKPYNIIKGVANVSKAQISLWDQLSNPNKVSFRNVDNADVSVHKIDGMDVMIVYVKEAPENMKPVYVGGKRENTYIRTGDGDRMATKQEIEAFERNAQTGHDSLPAEHFTMNDLDLDSVITYKEKVSKRYPKKKYIEMSHQDFLTEIGACYIDRSSGELKVRRGTLLFLGKCNSIKELYPQYHLDYFNRQGNNPRWTDRVTDDEPGDYEMNLFNFYTIVYEKLKSLLMDGFNLDEGQIRLPISDFDETLREGLVNCLAHADYIQAYPSTKIEVFDGWFRFQNPGKMLVSTHQFRVGGDSRPRNEIIMKMFRLLGVSERQGFGGPLIYKTALSNDFKSPEVFTDIERTELRIWNIDLADSYPELGEEEKLVLRYIVKQAEPLSINQIRAKIEVSEYKMRKIITVLEEKNIIHKIGNGSSTKYEIVKESTEFLTQMQMELENLKMQNQ